jgi:ATP-dependent Clp protease ATP-binding subunit ClpA
VAANVLKNLGVDLRKVRIELEKIVQTGPDDALTTGRLPQTPRAKKVIEYAVEEARYLNHNYVGTEHLLLGLIREQEGVAAQVLMNLGLRLEDLRREVMNLLGQDVSLISGERKVEDNVRYRGLPELIRHELEGLDALIAQMSADQQAAVLSQEFKRAAELRVQLERLKKQRYLLLISAGIKDPTTKRELSAFVYSEYPSFPIDIQKQLLELDAGILRLNAEKEQAVADQDFEKAASLRDQGDKLVKQWQGIYRQAQSLNRREPVSEYDLLINQQPPDVVARLRVKLVDRFGGYSEHTEEISGEWKVGAVTFRGSILVFRVLAEELLHPRDFFKTLVQQLRVEMKIEQVAVIERKVDIL